MWCRMLTLWCAWVFATGVQAQVVRVRPAIIAPLAGSIKCDPVRIAWIGVEETIHRYASSAQNDVGTLEWELKLNGHRISMAIHPDRDPDSPFEVVESSKESVLIKNVDYGANVVELIIRNSSLPSGVGESVSTAVVMFRHWLVFDVSTDYPCEESGQDSLSLEEANRIHLALRAQTKLFLASLNSHPMPTVSTMVEWECHFTGLCTSTYRNGTMHSGKFVEVSVGHPLARMGEDTFEAASLASAVQRAVESSASESPKFLAVDLGAAFGLQALNSIYLARKNLLEVKAVAVEAQKDHYLFMLDAFHQAGIDPQEHDLIQAAVSDFQGTIWMDDSTDPHTNWGQTVVGKSGTGPGQVEVPTVTLPDILAGHPMADIVHLDIQGQEAVVLEFAAESGVLDKVRAVHVSTHGAQFEYAVLRLFARLRWHNIVAFSGSTHFKYREHKVKFGDGHQAWVNPRLGPNPRAQPARSSAH